MLGMRLPFLPLHCGMSELSALCALGKTFFSGACKCVDLARRPSSLEEPHTGASGLLCMAPFPQLLPHCEDLGPTPKRPSASATLLFSNAQTMCTTDILNCTMMISCFILHVIYWAFWVVGWWTFFRRRQWNCAMMISSFNLLWFLLFAFLLWWQYHYILPSCFCMYCFVFVNPYILCVCYWPQVHYQWCLHMICWLFYFWPHPIDDDVSIPIHLCPLSCRSETTATKVLWISQITKWTGELICFYRL